MIPAAAAALLIVMYAVSFIPAVKRRNAEKSVLSALMNKKYEGSVHEIQIAEGENSIRLYNQNNSAIWEGSIRESIFPVDNSVISRFIQHLTNTRNLYKISDRQTEWPLLGVDKDNATTILYKNDMNVSTKLYFGGQNFLKTRRYLRIDNKLSIYEIDSDIDAYLTPTSSVWMDPYIVPQNVNGKITQSDIQRIKAGSKYFSSKYTDFGKKCADLLELRHGDLYEGVQDIPVYSIAIEDGDGFTTTIHAYGNGDEGKILSYSFSNTITGHPYDYKYSVLVSNWTFNKMTELFSSASAE
jgi:hypothetical protein